MKPNPLKLLTVALAVDRATSFLTNRPTHSIVRARVDSVFTHFAVSDVRIDTSADSTFPYGDDAVRFAYDEWRMKFAKGAFDPVRFESFKINFKTLTTANLEARNKASAEGGDPPAWMSLNEYGDYSMAEYEAMKRGEPIPTPAVQPTPQHNLAPVEQNQSQPPAAQPNEQVVGNNMQTNGLNDADRESVLEMGKALQYAEENLEVSVDVGPMSPGQVARESRLRSLYQTCPKAYEAWCVQYGKEPDAIRFATFSNNYVAMREFAERSGKGLKLNKYADCTKDEYARIVNPPSPEELARQKAVAEAKMAIQRAEAATLVEKRAAEQRKAGNAGEYQDQFGRTIRPTSQESRKTELIDDVQPPVRPTEVIKRADQPPGRPTLVIQKSDLTPVRPTEVIKRADQPSSFGTQVIKSAEQPPVRPTEVINKSGQGPARKTVLIDENTRRTKPLRRTDLDNTRSKEGGEVPVQLPEATRPVRPTIVMNKKATQAKGYVTDQTTATPTDDYSPADPERGTFVLRSSQPEDNPVRGTVVIKKKDQSSGASRGTVVLKKREPDSAGPVGQVPVQIPEATRPVRPTIVMNKRATQAKGYVADQTTTTPTDDSPADPERGTFVLRSSQPEENPVRGTVVIKKKDQSSGASLSDDVNDAAGRGTIVIKRQIPEPKEPPNPFVNLKPVGDVIQETPSVFSFFGGAKKASQAPRSVRGTIVLQKSATGRAKPAGRETVLTKKSQLGGAVPSIFSFFGGAKKIDAEEAARDPNARATLSIKKPKNDWRSDPTLGSSPSQVSSQTDTAPKDDQLAAQLELQRAETLEMKQKREVMETEKERKRIELQEKRAETAREKKELSEAKEKMDPKLADEMQPAFSFFGNPQSKAESKVEDKAKSSSYNVFGAANPASPTQIPEIRLWKQNADGSITGIIHDSRNFKDGTRVTTSPVRIGVTRGSVVRTGSGSQYSLQ